MKKETDGNQAATQSSGDNRGSEALKANSQTDSPSLLGSVETARQHIYAIANKLTSIWDVEKANGWQQLNDALDAYAAAVRADAQPKSSQTVHAAIEAHDKAITDLQHRIKRLSLRSAQPPQEMK